MDTKLKIGKYEFNSRFILGSGKFNIELIKSAIFEAEAEIITMAIRRANTSKDNILDFVPDNIKILPNTSGARNAQEALRIARLARELSGADMIKIEVIKDSKYLFPDNHETIKAVELLKQDGFIPMAYMYPDLSAARDMVSAGADAIMPLAAPIGTNKGLLTKDFIKILIDEIDVPIIVDAGLGRPSEAAYVMEMGADAVMANTAIATASDIKLMAKAFKLAIEAGRMAYISKLGKISEYAVASSPLTGFLD